MLLICFREYGLYLPSFFFFFSDDMHPFVIAGIDLSPAIRYSGVIISFILVDGLCKRSFSFKSLIVIFIYYREKTRYNAIFLDAALQASQTKSV